MKVDAVQGRSGASLRIIGAGIVLCVGLAVAAAWLVIGTSTFDGWQHGDWLINYAGGAIRRGASGTLIQLTFGANSLLALTILQSGILLVLYACFAALFLRTSGESAWFMAVLSPTVLLFPLLGIGGGLRKEIIALAIIGLISVGVVYRRPVLTLALMLPAFLIGALSHELVALTLPAIIWLVRFACTSRHVISAQQMRVFVALYSAISVGALLVAVLAPGNSEQQAQICASWASLPGVSCDSGALMALSDDLSSATAGVLSRFPAYALYAVSAVLAALPLILVGFLRNHWKISLLVAASITPLFISGLDYGRWIYIWATTLTLLALVSNAVKPLAVARVPWVIAVAYIVLWRVPWFGQALAGGLLVRLGREVVDRLPG